MSTPVRHSIRVQVGGEELTLRTELPPDYAREIAAHFDTVLRQIRAASPSLEAHKAAIVAGLSVTDELFRSRRTDAEVAARLQSMNEQIARLLPPTKRGSRGAGTD